MSVITSKISQIPLGSGRNKETIFTATRTTKLGDGTFHVDILQYNDALGAGGRVIGVRDPGNPNKVNWNDNATGKIKLNQGKIKEASKGQMQSMRKDFVTNAQEAERYNASQGNRNTAISEGEDQTGDLENPKITSQEGARRLNSEIGASDQNTRNSFGHYVFPENIRQGGGKGQDFIKFDMMKYTPRQFAKKQNTLEERERLGEGNRKSIGSVILPIPAGIGDQQNVGWQQDEMDPLQIAAAETLLASMDNLPQGGETAVQKIESAFRDLPEISTALKTILAGGAVSAGNLLTRTTGAIVNPNMELLFQNPTLRSFSFSFLLSPRNEKEAKEVVRIIRFFKQGMAPIRSQSRLFLKSPHTFQLRYRNSNGTQHDYLNNFKECALESFTTQYTPHGQYATFKDGVMTSYQIQLGLRELTPVYNDDYGNSGNLPAQIGF